ncbi:MAG TPA: hypothetical protein VFP65_16705 [Anaeromyxobacteraceae bacterium]|nr:hypothetical protein [Anaeromyxobacteraceae bacterium]
MEKTLDRRLAALAAGSVAPDDFVIADAKDADMARGLGSAGPRRAGRDGRAPGGFRGRREFLDDMGEIVRQGEVDILLASASSAEELTARGVFAGSGVTLAIRANDTTDVWLARHSTHARAPSRPFRSASLSRVRPFCDLGLYSVTFNNDLERDLATVEAYAAFREDALRHGFRHFLEVFNPNAPVGLSPEAIPEFVNDCIHRTLAGLTRAERPLFLKIVYNGPRALEELVADDPGRVVGILGGSAGTTRDCYELLAQGARHGARVALFGRKIQLAEAPLELVPLMRPVVRGELAPAEAVRAYHAALERRGLRPARSLSADSEITDPVLRG